HIPLDLALLDKLLGLSRPGVPGQLLVGKLASGPPEAGGTCAAQSRHAAGARLVHDGGARPDRSHLRDALLALLHFLLGLRRLLLDNRRWLGRATARAGGSAAARFLTGSPQPVRHPALHGRELPVATPLDRLSILKEGEEAGLLENSDRVGSQNT